ncbi:peptidase E [Arthrobacter sp. TES]|uniref:Type 1 glutamine amidotransferase-like domain-containing protein n=1 Tax=Paenarthrobacter TaxID=1742992 RepID=UPI0003962748|nr:MULTISPECIES: peptidase E [Paenarthrobacter]AOY73318.1 peptidase [Arthrobacter sp. ZXY-2]ERI35802.1 peptidase [Arthrobacter sp. AK-YN10]QOI64866.1 peptidase E [Arthrobacter sp. TES]MCW3765680.1 peptidase E [Paenarthrobacter sp. PAE-2]GLU58219.1 peptidase E [Paenarthrobacter ureafaciens]
MAAGQPTILATSGGYKPGSRTRIEFDSVMHYAVELAGVTGRAPRVTHIGTASGDQRWWAAEMDQAARIAGFDFSHLNLFTMPNVEDPEAHLLEQDVVWVNGGSVVNLLAVWRAHGLDRHLRKAWENGVVLAGVSAGSICWFKGGVTDSFGPELKPVTNSLGFLPFHNGVHFDSELRRRPLVHKLVANGTLGETHCTDDGVGLVYHGTELTEVVSSVKNKAGFRVIAGAGESVDAIAVEERLESRFLG